MNRQILLSYVSVVIVMAALGQSRLRADESWPQFRGVGARGVVDGSGPPMEWSLTDDGTRNIAWKTAVPGRSWSSPIVTRGRVFLTSAVSAGKDHEPKKGLYFGGNRPEPLPDEHTWIVLGYDLESGRELWRHKVHSAKPSTGIHVKNTYASETAVTDGERVFAYFGGVGLFAFDLDGKPLWERRMEPVPTRYSWGSAASPVLHKGVIYIVNDNEKQSWIAAFKAETGDTIWKKTRDEKSNWATPFVWEHAERTEIVTPGSGKVRSYGLDGELLWELTGMSSITIATPYVAHGMLIVSSGYVGDKSRPLYAIKPGAKGDISLKEGGRTNESIAWSQPQGAPYNPSTVVYGDLLYTLLDFGFFRCFDARMGNEVYGKKRLTVGVGFTASPWAYNGHVFCLDEDGTTHVVRAGDEFEVVRQNPLGEMCMATPAIVGKRLVVRTLSSLVCIAETESANRQPSPIFDGKTLDGWSVVPAERSGDWKAVDGVIRAAGSTGASYLVFDDKDIGDFELTFRYRMLTAGNTGVEIRSRVDKSGKRPFEAYHADLGHVGIGPAVLGAWDMHFATRREHPIPRGTRVVIDADGKASTTKIAGSLTRDDVKKRDWNDVRVLVRGYEFRFWINGKVASELFDNFEKGGRLDRGALALQLHESGTQIEFADLKLSKL